MAVTGGIDMATLGIRVDASEVERAIRVLSILEQQGKKTEEGVKRVGNAASGAGSGISRLRQPLTALTYQLAGTNPQLTQLTSILGSLAFGGAVTVGVVAGITAIAAAFRLFTRDSREAAEAQREQREEFEKWLETQRRAALGPGGVQNEQLRAEEAKLAKLRRDLAIAQQITTEGVVDAPRIADLERQIAKQADIVKRGQVALSKVYSDAENERIRKLVETQDRTIAEHKRGADEGIRIAEREAAEYKRLQIELAEWQRQHGFVGLASGPVTVPGGLTGRATPALYRSTGNIYVPPVSQPSSITAEQRAAADALNRVQEETRKTSEQFWILSQALSQTAQMVPGATGAILSIASSAAAGFATGGPLGALIGGGIAVASKVADWFTGRNREREEEQRRELEARRALNHILAESARVQAEFTRGLKESLGVRGLRATGRGDAADVAALQQAQQREREGFQQQFPLTWILQPDYLELLRVQAQEMAALNNSIEERIALERQRAEQEAHAIEQAAKLAEEHQREADAARAAADAVRMLADAANQLAAQREVLQSWGDLNVRSLAATGFGDEAEALRLQLRHQREGADASSMDAAFRAELARVQALELQALYDSQRARATGTGGVTALGGGGDAYFGSLVQEDKIRNVKGITESQAVRLADIAVISLAVLRQIERNTRRGSGNPEATNEWMYRENSRSTQTKDGDMAVTK